MVDIKRPLHLCLPAVKNNEGPLVDPGRFQNLTADFSAQIAAFKKDNAEIVTGGNEPDLPGFFLEPTVVGGLRQEDEMIQREIFGPILCGRDAVLPRLAKMAADNLRRAAIANVTVREADGAAGLSGEAPFDVILLSGSVATAPRQLLEQLNRVLETRDTPRGLVVTMADVLFATGKYDLAQAARERGVRIPMLKE